MTLCYFNNMCLFAKFLVYFVSIFDIVICNDDSKYLFVELLVQYSSGLGGGEYVSMALRYNLPTDASFGLGHVVDRGSDSPVESFVVHSHFIRLVEHGCRDFLALFLIFLINLQGE